MFIHFPSPASFPHLPPAVSWAGYAFASALPFPPLSPLHRGSVLWQCGEYTFDKHHISGTVVCAHVWLHHRKKIKKKEKKKEKKSPFLSQNHGNLLICV